MGDMCSKVREKEINSLMEHTLSLQRELAIKEVDLENTRLKLNEYKKSFDKNIVDNSKKKPKNDWYNDVEDLNDYKKNVAVITAFIRNCGAMKNFICKL